MFGAQSPDICYLLILSTQASHQALSRLIIRLTLVCKAISASVPSKRVRCAWGITLSPSPRTMLYARSRSWSCIDSVQSSALSCTKQQLTSTRSPVAGLENFDLCQHMTIINQSSTNAIHMCLQFLIREQELFL